jgi:hypothetical protein
MGMMRWWYQRRMAMVLVREIGRLGEQLLDQIGLTYRRFLWVVIYQRVEN